MSPFVSRRSAWLLTMLAASVYVALIWITPRGFHRPVAVLALGMAALTGWAAVFDALRQRDLFLAAASHDLQTPVSSIRLSTRRLRRDVRSGKTLEPEELVRELDYQEAAAMRVQDVVADLLDVARLQMGQTLELDRESVDLVVVARRVADDHLRGLEPHQVRIETADSKVVGYWDEARLEGVIGNLVSNAVKYSPPEAEVLVSIDRASDPESGRPVAVLRVHDRGICILREDLPRVFEQFHRARNTGGRRGIGIGLAAARQIVQHHGGSIAVESRENEGSTFEVRLPLD